MAVDCEACQAKMVTSDFRYFENKLLLAFKTPHNELETRGKKYARGRKRRFHDCALKILDLKIKEFTSRSFKELRTLRRVKDEERKKKLLYL